VVRASTAAAASGERLLAELLPEMLPQSFVKVMDDAAHMGSHAATRLTRRQLQVAAVRAIAASTVEHADRTETLLPDPFDEKETSHHPLEGRHPEAPPPPISVVSLQLLPSDDACALHGGFLALSTEALDSGFVLTATPGADMTSFLSSMMAARDEPDGLERTTTGDGADFLSVDRLLGATLNGLTPLRRRRAHLLRPVSAVCSAAKAGFGSYPPCFAWPSTARRAFRTGSLHTSLRR
jgi:hypothetical protein